MSFSQFHSHPIVLGPIECKLTDFQYGAHPTGITASISYQIWLDLIFAFLGIYFWRRKNLDLAEVLVYICFIRTPPQKKILKNENTVIINISFQYTFVRSELSDRHFPAFFGIGSIIINLA